MTVRKLRRAKAYTRLGSVVAVRERQNVRYRVNWATCMGDRSWPVPANGAPRKQTFR